MRRIGLGITRTGEILVNNLPYVRGKERFSKDLRGEDIGELTIALEALPPELSNIDISFKDKTRFIFVEDTNQENPIVFAGPISKIRKNRNKTITIFSSGMIWLMEQIPAVPPSKRERILTDEEVFVLGGSPRLAMRSIISNAQDDYDGYPTLQSLKTYETDVYDPNYSKNIELYSLPSVKEYIESIQNDYEGVEMRFIPRFVEGDTSKIEWFLEVGEINNPHINKNLPPYEVNIDADDGNLNFESITDGTARGNANWVWYQSQEWKVEVDKWINLQAKRSMPTDPEEFMVFSKDKTNEKLEESEVKAQIDARLAVHKIKVKTFNVSQFNEGQAYIQNLGRRIHFVGNNSITGLDETVRIVNVKWTLDSEKVEIMVQPEDYRVYPKVPKLDWDPWDLTHGKDWSIPNSGLPSWNPPQVVVPPDWGDQGPTSILSSPAIVNLNTAPSSIPFALSTASKYNDYLLFARETGQGLDTDNVNASWRNIIIRNIKINGAGQVVSKVSNAGTLPASYIHDLTDTFPATNALVNIQGKTVATTSWVVENRFYLYIAVSALYGPSYAFGAGTYNVPSGVRYLTRLVYCGINSNGTLDNSWNTAPGIKHPSYPDDHFFPEQRSITRYGADNKMIGVFSMMRLRDRIAGEDAVTYITQLCMTQNYSTPAGNALWGEVERPPYIPFPRESLNLPELEPISVFSAGDGYIYAVNNELSNLALPRPTPNNITVYRTNGVTNNLGTWTKVMELPASTGSNSVAHSVIAYNGYVVVNYNSNTIFGVKKIDQFGTVGSQEELVVPANYPSLDSSQIGDGGSLNAQTTWPAFSYLTRFAAFSGTARPYTFVPNWSSKMFMQGNYIYFGVGATGTTPSGYLNLGILKVEA